MGAKKGRCRELTVVEDNVDGQRPETADKIWTLPQNNYKSLTPLNEDSIMGRDVPSVVMPSDRFYFVYITMYLFGVTSLLPWNFFITATDYWNYKFRNISSTVDNPDQKTPIQTVFPTYLAIASKVPYVVFLAVNTVLSYRLKASLRIGIPLIAAAMLFIATTALVKVNTDSDQEMFLGVTLGIVVVINVAGAFLQGGGTGIAGCLPSRYMRANVNGQAVGGIFASVVQILSLVAHTSPQNSALAYFLCAIVFLIITIICFFVMIKTDFYNFFIFTQVGNYRNSSETNTRPQVSLLAIFKQIWTYAVSVVLIFWVTISVFPGITALTESVNKSNGSEWTNRLFLPVACFLLFNIADLSGRVVATWIPMPRRWKLQTLALCCARIVFVPLFLLCNTNPHARLPIVFNSDGYFVAFIAAFGITNGYLCNVVMTHGPKRAEVHLQETAGTMMAVFLGLGLMLGSVSSLPLVAVLH